MGSLTRNCPHCHSANSTFTSFSEHADPNKRSPQLFCVSLYCGSCHQGYYAVVAHHAGHSPHTYSGNLDAADHLILGDEYPRAESLAAPEYLPGNIESFFLQSAANLKSDNLDASAMMSRKVLEVAVKTLHPEGSGTLYNRIEKLHELGMITDDLKDWAHIIRDNGNEAAHEEVPVNPEFASELLSFTELFLMYSFTMPGMVTNRRRTDEPSYVEEESA